MRTLFLAIVMWGTNVANATIAPKNNYYIPESFGSFSIAKTAFNQALDRVEDHYAPIVSGMGYELVINRLWSDGTVNSDTYEDGNQWVINSYGGLARWPGMTTASYAAVACHELGHHMGGAPLYTGDDWASVEGACDYWATKECMKAIGYSSSQIKAASVVLAKVLADLGDEPVPSASKYDKRVVKKTFEDHPAAQCRLDTMLQGFNCPKRGKMSKTDPKKNSCWKYPTSKTYAEGDRPRCWFKP